MSTAWPHPHDCHCYAKIYALVNVLFNDSTLELSGTDSFQSGTLWNSSIYFRINSCIIENKASNEEANFAKNPARISSLEIQMRLAERTAELIRMIIRDDERYFSC